MKKQIILIAVLVTAFFSHSATAQVSLQVNIGAQPIWGPTGYDHVDYYYIPDVDAYYDVNSRQYIYMENNGWVTRPGLPPRYANFDLYNAHKVVINERTPWMHGDRYRTQYAQYRGRHDQHPIRDSREPRYYENPQHPQHAQWHGNPGGPHGNDHGGHDEHGHEGHGHEDHGHEDHGHEDHGHDDHGHR